MFLSVEASALKARSVQSVLGLLSRLLSKKHVVLMHPKKG